MFGFMKRHSERDREEKERKKKEKKDKKEKKVKDKTEKLPLTSDELNRLEDIKRSLAQHGIRGTGVDPNDGGAVPYHANYGESTTSESSSVSSSGAPTPTREAVELVAQKYTQRAHIELTKPNKPPAVHPKPSLTRPKKSILKGKSSYGPEIPNQGVRGNLDDTVTLEQNTYENEIMSGQIPSNGKKAQQAAQTVSQLRSLEHRHGHSHGHSPSRTESQKQAASASQPPAPAPLPEIKYVEIPPSSPSPVEKSFDVELKLPNLNPPQQTKIRQVTVRRQPAGDFGFTLRKGTLLERDSNGKECKRIVVFAEPGGSHGSLRSGLLPGDRLLTVNGISVEGSSREEIIDLIRRSDDVVRLTVQPIPELSELSTRSGFDGVDFPLGEQQVMTGSLKRSGSLRFKNKSAKSDDQLETEKAWMAAEKGWLVHKGGFAGARLLTSDDSTLSEGKVKVKLEHGGQELVVDEEDVEKANPPNFDRVEDLASLRYLNESSLLHTLRQRYGSNLIHTYAGHSLIVVNPMHPISIYSDKVIQMFRGCKQEDMPPHIFSAAQGALKSLLITKKDQSIMLMGRSGSGKTSNIKHLLQYLAVAAGSTNSILTGDKLSAIFTLLEAFGSSRTIMNTNATRYTAVTSLDFDHAGQVVSASVQVFMLEKSRVVRRPEGEPTFHVFYQFLAGIEANLRAELQLQNLSEPNLFMTPLQRVEDRQRATQAWAKVMHAFSCLGFSSEETKAILAVLAAIYHLGCAGVTKGTTQKYQFAKPSSAQQAAHCLGVSPEELSRCVFNPGPAHLTRSSSFRGPQDKGGDHVAGMEALEGFVTGLYQEAFTAMISIINNRLTSSYRSAASILVVDSPGFQNPASCGRQGGASFEELCYNYCQERLQLLFHDVVFTSQLDKYAQENIECEFETVMVSTPAPMVELIDKPSPQSLVHTSVKDRHATDVRGLLWILDEEAIFPGATEDSFMERLYMMHGERSDKKSGLLRKCNDRHSFLLNHYQGTNPVMYNVQGWLKAARENPLVRVAASTLQDSNKPEIASIYSSIKGPVSSVVGGSLVGMDGSSSLRRTSSMRRTYQSGAAGIKRKSVSLQVKFQMDSLVDMLRRTRIHFVHFLLPQHNAGLCDLRAAQSGSQTPDDIVMNVPLVRHQIRGSEILEAIRIHRLGYPEQVVFADFRRRFEILAGADSRPQGPVIDEKKAVEQLLEQLEVDKVSYRVGLSQVFFRAGVLAQLENACEEKISGFITKVQAISRGYLGRQKAAKLKVQHMAVACIQRNVKKFMAIRSWPWWRLYVKIQPLLNVHRTEQELRTKDEEVEDLRKKVEKLERERGEYKHACDQLETKMSEMTADLADEHTTSNQASEMLEREMAERVRLQRECQEIQGRYSSLQKKHEVTEMDLYQAQLLVASLDEELEDEESEGDSVYKQKYERSRRENELAKKKAEQQQEEEIEKHAAIKKQLERKLAEVNEDCEDQRRLVSNLKRKSQRLTTDMSDIKLHLEEQISRNTDLEKRQRKFDNELMNVSEQAKTEKLQREKLQKERDELSTELYTAQQELKGLKVDNDLMNNKLLRLQKDLDEFSSVGSKDDHEVLHLKRMKSDLEQKVLDQEEELDDQAGTIHQLEQAKLRLEMAMEKLRQQHSKEMEEREEELEQMRFNIQKRVKTLEQQLEEEYSEKQNALKGKRELERQLHAMGEQTPVRDKEIEKRLRGNLKKTKAMLRDAQVMLDKHKEGSASKATIKQLRDQLEDKEFSVAAAQKAKKGLELELQEVQQQMEMMSKSKQEVEDKYSATNREKMDALSVLEDNEEEMKELMKKYKAAVQQQSVDNITIQAQSTQIEELLQERQMLKEKLDQVQSHLTYLQESTADKQVVIRLETKNRELEAKHELEQTLKQRAEAQVSRLREQLETTTEAQTRLQDISAHESDMVKKLQRQLAEAREELSESQRREAEAELKKSDLERRFESIESDYEQSQSDLRLAMRRINDLQFALEEVDTDDSDLDDNSDIDYGSDTDTDDELEEMVEHHRRSVSSHHQPRGSTSVSPDDSELTTSPSDSAHKLSTETNGPVEGER